MSEAETHLATRGSIPENSSEQPLVLQPSILFSCEARRHSIHLQMEQLQALLVAAFQKCQLIHFRLFNIQTKPTNKHYARFFFFHVTLPCTFSAFPGREQHPATLRRKGAGCRAEPLPGQRSRLRRSARAPAAARLAGRTAAFRAAATRPRPRRGGTRRAATAGACCRLPALLTQQQPGLHDADLQVGTQVLHETAPGCRRRLLLHLQAGAAPRLDDPPAAQCCHAGALLP